MMRTFAALTGVILIALAAYVYMQSNEYVRVLSAYRLSPTAEEALALGQMHFDSHRPALYDIDEAQKYLEEAYKMNPRLRAVNHELGRIAFLRGEFDTALSYLDAEIEMYGETMPRAFYVRGLIQGFRGEYDAAALDYLVYLKYDPESWAAINDYSWVLLKSRHQQQAAEVLEKGLEYSPNNPWLLNNASIAYYELGNYQKSQEMAMFAQHYAESLTADSWLTAYPGNDPKVAQEGIVALRQSIADNMHMAARALSVSAI